MTAARIGLIVPPAAGRVPPEAAMFPHVRFAARGLGLAELTIQGYDAVIDRVATLAHALRDEEGAQAVSLMGTSLSFFRGGDFNATLTDVIARAAGVPATTMSSSIARGLRAVDARRVAVGTAYVGEVNERLRAFLEAEGYEVASLVGMDMTDPDSIQATSADAVADLGRRAAHAAEGADAVLVSCGGLPAGTLAPTLEPELGLPVVASATAGLWDVLRQAGLDARAPGLGALGGSTDAEPRRAAS